MAQKLYKVEFDFVSSKADGDLYKRTVEVKASTAVQAENIAWMQRVSFFGERGNDNAIDCRAIKD